jgi:hypothetical protein
MVQTGPTSQANSVSEVVARPKGFEPLTPRFVVWCSIQLSYGRILAPAVITAREALPDNRSGDAMQAPSSEMSPRIG